MGARGFLGSCFVLCVLSWACAGDPGSRGDAGGGSGGVGQGIEAGSGGIPLASFPAAYADALCSYGERCFGDAIADIGGPDCRSRQRWLLEEGVFPAYTAAVEQRRMSYSRELAAECVAALSIRPCTLAVRFGAYCEEIFGGQVTEGEPCEFTSECAAGLACTDAPNCEGTCERRAAEGEACAADHHCAEGLVCSDVRERCEPPLPTGAPCGISDRCAGGGLCGVQSGVYEDPPWTFVGEGAQCDPNLRLECSAGLRCVRDAAGAGGAGSHCTRETFVSGGPCRRARPDACPDGSWCNIPEGGFAGNCEELPREGAACTPARWCGADLFCSLGTCVPARHLGEACSNGGECFSFSCVDGRCAPDSLCQE